MATDTQISVTPSAPAAMKMLPGVRIAWGTLLTYIILSLGAIVMFFPFIWMTLSAFKQPDEIIAYPPIWLPANPSLDLLSRIWTEIDFKRFFLNSLFVATTATACQLFTSALNGYVLAKYQFPGRNLMFIMILCTMMVPWPVLLIPQYLIALNLKILNTYWALILPALYSAFGIFLMRQYMHSIPDELLDAARIDGASEPAIFARIILPLTGPALAALGIFHFMWHWDSFIWPLIVINSESMYTLPLGLATFVGQYWTDYAAVNAGAFISVIPVVVVFLLLQRRFIEGIAMTGLKG
jgi:ABC-type glycerol-3-phosphate transport system permease component